MSPVSDGCGAAASTPGGKPEPDIRCVDGQGEPSLFGRVDR
jgi:hypothetical protein